MVFKLAQTSLVLSLITAYVYAGDSAVYGRTQMGLTILPKACYETTLVEGRVFNKDTHYLDEGHKALNILGSLANARRLSPSQREKPMLAAKILRMILGTDYQPIITNYKKNTSLTASLQYGASSAWRALVRYADQHIIDPEMVKSLRDALDLTADAIHGTTEVISPGRKLGALRQATGYKAAIIPNYFPEVLGGPVVRMPSEESTLFAQLEAAAAQPTLAQAASSSSSSTATSAAASSARTPAKAKRARPEVELPKGQKKLTDFFPKQPRLN